MFYFVRQEQPPASGTVELSSKEAWQKAFYLACVLSWDQVHEGAEHPGTGHD